MPNAAWLGDVSGVATQRLIAYTARIVPLGGKQIGITMKLVWHDAGLWEVDFVRDVFGDVISSEITDLDLEYTGDNSIHVVNTTRRPLKEYATYFARCRSQASQMALLHLGDEWFDGDYRVYGFFDRVVRQYDAWFVRSGGILPLPLGYEEGLDRSRASTPVTERTNLLFFSGAMKSSRFEMARALRRLQPHFLRDISREQPLGGGAYSATLSNSVFVPCPMGSVVAETIRLYSAMEAGCIPLIETRWTLNYYRMLLGPNPIPAFSTWSAAARYCASLASDPAALVDKQREIQVWWTSYKADLKRRVTDFMSAPSFSQDLTAFATKPRNRVQAIHQPLRLTELLRHQSVGSFARRLSKPREPLRRIVHALAHR